MKVNPVMTDVYTRLDQLETIMDVLDERTKHLATKADVERRERRLFVGIVTFLAIYVPAVIAVFEYIR